MTALIVSDLHYRWPRFEWVLKRAVGLDAVFLPGDLLDLFCSDPPLPMQASWGPPASRCELRAIR